MKRKLYYIIAFCLTLVACRNLSNNDVDFQRNDEKFQQDTSLFHSIISKIENNNYPNNDSALILIHQALDLSNKHEFETQHSEALFLKGKILTRKNMFQEALEAFSEAKVLAEKQKNDLLTANCLAGMASVNLSIGDDHLAMRLYFESLPLFEKTGNKEGIANVYNIIGGHKSALKEYDSAESFFVKAIKLNEEIGNQAGIIHNNANLAFMYHDMDKNDKAKELYAILIPQLIETGDSANLSVVYYHFSIFFQWDSQSDSSIIYLRKALEISEKLVDKSFLPTLNGMLGMVLLEQQQYDPASYYLTKSANLAANINDYFTQEQSLKLLLSIDTLKGDLKKATQRYGEILVINDSVYNQRIRNNVEASELKYINQKKANIIEIQDIKIATANRQKRYFVLLFTFSIIISALLLIVVVLIRRNKRKALDLLAEQIRIKDLQIENALQTEEINRLSIENGEKELRLRKKEQVTNALALEQKNELLSLINNKINKAMAGDGILTISELIGVVSAIKSQIKDSDDLFNQKFDQLHHVFFDNLKKSHPELTKSELKFCAYLKLRLTSNQIASLMHVTLEAIRKSRYRIRKKLGLERDASLEDYISRF
jgi:tetratricopeptide (TPR) repeat protein